MERNTAALQSGHSDELHAVFRLTEPIMTHFAQTKCNRLIPHAL